MSKIKSAEATFLLMELRTELETKEAKLQNDLSDVREKLQAVEFAINNMCACD